MGAIGRNAMAERVKNLEKSWKERTLDAQNRARLAITQLEMGGKDVTFATVQKVSGLSKNFLYKDKTIRKEIETLRTQLSEIVSERKFRYQKTSRSKDVVLEAKDRRIAKLEEENRQLKAEIKTLRGLLYETK